MISPQKLINFKRSGAFKRAGKFEEAKMKNSLKERIDEIKDWLIGIRREIHMHPELGFEEVNTSRLVSEWLERFGLEVQKGVAGTGVVGLLRGKSSGKTIALRADMDALPLEELNEVPYASKIKGKMHACGHDAHVTILLGVARILSPLRDQIKGNIKWIFQPAEEGGGGGKRMVQEGVLENPHVDAIFGAHVYPQIEIGKVGVCEGKALASADRFTIKIIGRSGHAASPHLAKDPILAAGHLITQIHSIVSREVDPLESGVITIGRVSGGSAFNIIPDEVELLGTVRALSPEIQEKMKKRIEEAVQGVTQSFGMNYHYEYKYEYPVLVNEPEMIRLVSSACAEGIGEENVVEVKPSMGAEDFAFYLEKVPGAFFRLGIRNESKGIVHPYHNSRFDIDEEVLPFGVEMFIRIVDRFLGLGIMG